MSTTYKKKAPVAKKVTKEELKQLQEFVAKLNNGAMQVGNLELQKDSILKSIDLVRGDLTQFQIGLKEKYGDVKVDIETGKINVNIIE
tara:strand:- start:1085 stop:1348 length:264 start_codon:yes stop_codon:yes gene_type:complete